MLKLPWDEEGLAVVVDYESSGLHADDGAYPSTVGVKWGHGSDQQLSIPVDQGMLDKPGATPVLFGDAPNVAIVEWAEVHHWLMRQHIVMHNAKADLWFAWSGLRKDPGLRFDLSSQLHWDTMVVEALMHPGQRVSLDLVAERERWNEPYREIDAAMKGWTRKKGNRIDGAIRYDIAPWDLLKPYLEADLERTWKLYHLQRSMMKEGILPWRLVQDERELVTVLFDIERRGLPYKAEESLRWAAMAEAEMTGLAIEMKRLGFDPQSQDALVTHLRSHGTPMYKTEKGKWSIDQPTIAKAVELGVPGAEDYQRWSKLQTARSLWYLGWAEKTGKDGRIRADYRQVKTFEGNKSSGTVSGRFAVSRVNVQAIPSRYQVPDGYPAMQDLIASSVELWEADISQAEMRTVAVLSGCTPMLEGFRQGFDAHDSTTRLIWGIEKDDVVWDERRAVAKRLGFGVIYGAGIRTLAAQIRMFTGEDLGETGVRELWDQYRQAFPQLFRYNRQMQRQVRKHGHIVLPNGKLRVFQEWESEHKAMNAMIQGSVAVGMVRAMLEIEREIPGVQVGQVHDSVIFETDDPYVPRKLTAIISETFEELFPGCPFPVEAKPYASK